MIGISLLKCCVVLLLLRVQPVLCLIFFGLQFFVVLLVLYVHLSGAVVDLPLVLFFQSLHFLLVLLHLIRFFRSEFDQVVLQTFDVVSPLRELHLVCVSILHESLRIRGDLHLQSASVAFRISELPDVGVHLTFNIFLDVKLVIEDLDGFLQALHLDFVVGQLIHVLLLLLYDDIELLHCNFRLLRRRCLLLW